MDYFKPFFKLTHPNYSLSDDQSEPYLESNNQRTVNEDYWPSDNYSEANNLPPGQQDESTIPFGSISDSDRSSSKMSEAPRFSYRSNIGGRF